ncbi:hypothetical protein ARMGADRAFT_1160798 [Armillaria gallica]|uniref:Uncharacterized protein n=1 Tax=Armillaria gallica TaxID=47427 RepID=A0A2H3DY84_ARMGA|nr:hypothetical protein ARMGADRAFT_1160798 [Armillaria gallica]
MSRPESYSNPGQDHPRPSTPSECHRIFPLCAELSEAASCLPADTPDAIKKFCEIVLQKLPKDANSIKRFQLELFNSLLVDLMPVSLEYTIDPSSVEPPVARIRRVDDDRPGELSTDIDFSQIPLLEDVFDATEPSAAPFDLTLGAVDTNYPSPSQPPFSCCFIPDDQVLGGSGKVIEVDCNGKFSTRASDESTHDKGSIRTGPSVEDLHVVQSNNTETDDFPATLAACSAPNPVTAHGESASSAPVIKVINITPRTRPRSNTFVMAAPPQLPRTTVPPRYVEPSASSSSIASSSTLAVSTGSLCFCTPSDTTNNNDSSDSKEEKEQMRSNVASNPQDQASKDQDVSSIAISCPKQVAHTIVGVQSNKRSRDESPDPVDQEVSQKPCKIRRKSNDGREI